MDEELQQAAERFAAVARQYCAAVDAAHSQDAREFLSNLYPILVILVYKGLQLPVVSPATSHRHSLNLRAEMYSEVFSRLCGTLGSANFYNEVYYPWYEDEACPASLTDDLADIYLDMKEGLEALEAGKPHADILFEWQLGFTSHWGRHATDALRAIYCQLYD